MVTTTATSAAASHRVAPRRPLLSLVPTALLTLLWGGAAATVGMWWADTERVAGLGGWLTGGGRITGLLAGYACAVLMVLMARVPLLDAHVGSDRLARWHSHCGRYAVCLSLVHVLTITWGYSLTGSTGVVRQGVTLVLHYPEMLKATAGFLLLVMTGVVSARMARRRLRYETWHLLHMATYAALFLTFGHQLANGADFVGNRAAQVAWYALYTGAAALVLWFRFLAPLRFNLRHRVRVTEVRREAPGVVSVHVRAEHAERLTARPGQFFRWRFLTGGMWQAANPYSLSAPAGPHGLRITVKASGGHSAALAHLRPGTRVWLEGPYGGLTGARATGRGALLLAGGVGITPLRALFESLPGDVTLMYWARTPADLALRSELDAIAVRRGARVVYSVSEPAGHALPIDARTLAWRVPDIQGRDVYVCGPERMTTAARRALREAGVPQRRIHHESFSF